MLSDSHTSSPEHIPIIRQGNCLFVHHGPKTIVSSIISKLVDYGYQCQLAERSELDSRLQASEFNFLVIDQLSLWGAFYEFVTSLRDSKNGAFVLVLSEPNTASNRVAILDAGADCVLDKPLAFVELVARMDSLQRRKKHDAFLQTSALKLDLSTRRVTSNCREIKVTQSQFNLLELLVRNVNRVVPIELLCERIHRSERLHSKPDLVAASGTLVQHMSKLRKKLAMIDHHVLKTVRGEGYVLEVKQIDNASCT